MSKPTIKKCLSCGITNEGDDAVELYYCAKHKKTFCAECLGIHERVGKYNEHCHCHPRYYLSDFWNSKSYNPITDDCIYQKILIVDEEGVVA